MSIPFVPLAQMDSVKENSMSCVQYENFQIEISAGNTLPTQESKPFVLATSRIKFPDPATTVEEALERALANGSMPA